MPAVRRLLLPLVLLALAVLPARAATKDVAIRNLAYDPSTVTVAPGDSVTWTNHDELNHTVTGENDLTLQSGTMVKGRQYTKAFLTAGTFTYRCDFHQAMRGTVVVQTGGGTTTSTSTTSTTAKPSSTTNTTRRTTTTAASKESSVTAPGETTSSTTMPGGTTTTTVADEGSTTTTATDGERAVASGSGDGDGDPSHAGPAAFAALLLAAVSGAAALAVKRGL